jgi:uncharacterized Zn-finger protein
MKVSNIKLIEDNRETVRCSGDDMSGCHPQIFLKVNSEDGAIECYYCGKNFIQKSMFKKK